MNHEESKSNFSPRQLKYLTYIFLQAVEPNFEKLPLEYKEALWASYYSATEAIGSAMPEGLTLEALPRNKDFLRQAALKHLLMIFRTEPGTDAISNETFMEALAPEALQEVADSFEPIARTMLEQKPTLLLMEALVDFDEAKLAKEWESFNQN